MYRLILIHDDRAAWAADLQRQVSADLQDLGIDPRVLTIKANQTAVPADAVALGLYLASAQGRSSAGCLQGIDTLRASDVAVVPVVAPGDDFHTVVPDSLHPINALSAASLAGVSAAVLRWLGLTEKHRRVFVSYRRTDALFIGEQIWETLGKAGFEVFLDRFSIDPGVDFQERLTASLADKAFLLLIESPDVLTSPWVEYEVEYARKSRMGLLALTWPGSAGMANVFDKQRHFLNAEAAPDLVIQDKQGKLTDAFRAQLPALVEQAHARAMLARRRRLMGSVEFELRHRNIGYKLLSDWTLVAETHALTAAGDQIVSITPRPPEVPDLFLLDTHRVKHGGPQVNGTLLHTAASLGDERGQVLQWIVAARQLALVNEDQIVQMVDQFLTPVSSKP